MNEIPWVEKYRPKCINDLVGVEKIVKDIITFFEDFNKKKRNNKKMKNHEKALLLLGSPGVGKTTMVYAISHDLGYDVYEVNASDYRKKIDIKKISMETNHNVSLLNFTKKIKNRVIFIDEVDGMSGTQDRGGISEIISLINEAHYPIILVANYDNDKVQSLLKHVTKFMVPRHPVSSIVKRLKYILDQENMSCDKKILLSIAKKSKGDLRFAINSLQIFVNANKGVNENTLDILNDRDDFLYDEDIVLNVLNALSIDEGLYYLNFSTMRYEDILTRLGDTLINEFSSSHEFFSLVEADRILSHIKKTQDYSLLSYFFRHLASIGIYRSDKDAILRIQKKRWKNYGIYKIISIIRKIQNIYPLSCEKIYENVIPLLRNIQYIKNREFFDFLFSLSITEREWKESMKYV